MPGRIRAALGALSLFVLLYAALVAGAWFDDSFLEVLQ
jgi:hypothetical protein